MAANHHPTVYPMPPANADLATIWAFLEEGVDHIMTKPHTGVSYLKYMALSTVAYNYCTSSRMHGSKLLPIHASTTTFRLFLSFFFLTDNARTQ